MNTSNPGFGGSISIDSPKQKAMICDVDFDFPACEVLFAMPGVIPDGRAAAEPFRRTDISMLLSPTRVPNPRTVARTSLGAQAPGR